MQNLVIVCHPYGRGYGPKNGDAVATTPWDVGVAYPLETRHSSPCRIWSSRSNCTEICRKKLTSRVPPFKGTQGHRNQHGSIGYLWLPVGDEQ